MAFMQEVQRISSYLSSLSLCVSREWLTGCIEYFKEENSQYNARELQEFVRKQWELSDLRDSSEGSLPLNLHTQIKVTLNGKYALQIESVTNISESAYCQMQKIRKVDVVNVEATEKKPETWEPRPGRMLKFMLCDGVQKIQAVEYRSLHMLNEYIMPGTKILIIGPVDCRRGVLFLKAENVKVLGGEVDTLLTVNHYENVLAKVLGLPENPDPYSNKPPSPVKVLPTVSQRSTYTPSVAPLLPPPLQVNATRNARLVGASATSGAAQQIHMQDIFTNRSQPQTVAREDDLHGTGWTVDDLLAEGDDAFLEVPEEIPLTTVLSCSTPVSTNSTVCASDRSDRISKIPDCTQVGNPAPKMLQPSDINLNKQSTHQSSSKKNPFLASDEYLASVDMDEWEDQDESFSVPSKPKTVIFDNRNKQVSLNSCTSVLSQKDVGRNTCVPQNSNLSNIMDSSLNMDEWENEDLNENFVPPKPKTMLLDHCKKPVVSNLSKNTSLQTTFNKNLSESQKRNFSNTNNVLRNEQKTISTEFITPARSSPVLKQHIPLSSNTNVKREDLEKSNKQPNLLTSRVTLQKYDVMEGQKRTSFEQYCHPQLQNSEKQLDCNSNKKASSKQILKEMPKSLSEKLGSNISSSPSTALDNEEDWGDVYLSSQSAGFMHPFKDIDNEANLKSPSNFLNVTSFSRLSTLKPSSTSVNSLKNDSAYLSCPSTSSQSEVKISKPEIGAADRNSFLESRSSLFPALSSPSDMKCQLKCTKKYSETISPLRGGISDIGLTASSVGCKTLPLNQKCSSNVTTNTVCTIKKPAPFEYILHILKSTANKPCGTYRVKATIMSLLSQLKTDSSDRWSLSAKICDGTATLDVQFSSEVLDELIGLSAQEFKKMKKELCKNPLLKDKLIKLLQNSRQMLVNLNCVFDVKFETDKMAKVLKLREISEEDIDKLRSRLKDT